MIKEIIFKNTRDFSADPVSIKFSKNVNVIIGPKGGGKSTLFDLIAGLKNNYISDNVTKALEGYDLKFEKAIKFSNEEILGSQLSKKTKKEKEEDYKNRYDVIYQDDQIKKDLTNIKDIEDNKYKYLKKQIDISNNINEFIVKIKNLWQSMKNINEFFENEIVDINWSNTFKMKELIKKDNLILITKLDYKPFNLNQKLEDELNEYNNILTSIDEYNNRLNRFKMSKRDEIINDEIFDKNINDQVDLIIKNNLDLVKLILNRKELLEKIKSTSLIFLQSYKKIMEKIKSENYSSSGLKSYEIKARNHFKNLASNVYKAINNFETLTSDDVYLNIENDEDQKESLIYRIEENIKLSDEAKTEILKAVFYSPDSSRDDIGKWLKSLSKKGIKEFDENKIKNTISKELKDQVKVFVDFNNEKKDYESLSLGQKSIYGLKYKFGRSIKDNIYLDQPEDNLDNNTIAQEILPMLDQKNSNQVFIVTHNANIGILSNPEKVIIADLNNKKEPYKIAELIEIINDESAHYLEGGKEYLKQRYNKIINNKGE